MGMLKAIQYVSEQSWKNAVGSGVMFTFEIQPNALRVIGKFVDSKNQNLLCGVSTHRDFPWSQLREADTKEVLMSHVRLQTSCLNTALKAAEETGKSAPYAAHHCRDTPEQETKETDSGVSDDASAVFDHDPSLPIWQRGIGFGDA